MEFCIWQTSFFLCCTCDGNIKNCMRKWLRRPVIISACTSVCESSFYVIHSVNLGTVKGPQIREIKGLIN